MIAVNPTRTLAAGLLQVPSDCDASTATRAFLVHLSATGFVPSPQVVASENLLASLALPVGTLPSPSLAEEVEEFVEQYWSLTPSKRLAQWLILSTRRPDDRTAERLLSLQAGLELSAVPAADLRMERVIAIARDLYLLPPRQKAIRRNDWILSNAEHAQELVAMARAIQKQFPAVVALEPTLFASLSTVHQIRLFAEAARAEAFHSRSFGSSRPIPGLLPSPATVPSPRSRTKLPPTDGWTGKKWRRVIAFTFIWMALALIRVLFFGSDLQYRPPAQPLLQSPNSPHPQWSPPPLPQSFRQPQNLDGTFSFQQIHECREYDLKLRPLEPSCYPRWVLAGKPGFDSIIGHDQPIDSARSTDDSSPIRRKQP